MKRKLIEDVESYGSQRQSILDISMVKLRLEPKRRAEPSLRRNVLILNTLKQIETELEMEGVCRSPVNTSATVDSSLRNLHLDPLLDYNPSHVHCDPHTSHLMLSVAMETPTSLMPTTGTATKDLTTLSGPAGDFNNNSSSNELTRLCSAMCVDDDLDDIDVSVSESVDIYSFSSAIKLTPLSVDEVLHSFTSDSNQPLIKSQCRTSYRQEYPIDELDNIMQILIGQ